jgi:hypothetical protein
MTTALINVKHISSTQEQVRKMTELAIVIAGADKLAIHVTPISINNR